jgi:hypothetical protein
MSRAAIGGAEANGEPAAPDGGAATGGSVAIAAAVKPALPDTAKAGGGDD